MKTFKGISFIIISITLALSAIASASAETIYEYYGFSYTIVDNYSISLVGWDNRADSFSLPGEINGRSFVSVGNYALERNTQIKAVDFTYAKKLNRIGINAFLGCTGLDTEIVIPESVKTINDCAFQECTSLPKVTINADITNIPNQCFYKCSSLAEVSLPDTVESIEPWAFAYCTNLERIDIPKKVTAIAKSSFYNCASLTLGVWYESYGYNYAVENNIPHTLLDGVKLGDASGDGSVNINDVTMIQRYLAELETLEGIYLHAADANQDGTVDIADATIIQMYLAEYEMEYPIGEVMTQ